MYHPAPVDSTYRSNSGIDYILHVFNLGPDLRGFCTNNLTLDFAYTIRRGLKIGMAYIF